MNNTLTQDLAVIRKEANAKDSENEEFMVYLEDFDNHAVDELVHSLNNRITEQVDCTSCGNCCRSLIINVEPAESAQLAGHLNMSYTAFKEQFIEESQQGQLVVNTIPCHFLSNNKCSIYEHRFLQCREFPHLHKPGFSRRLPGTLMHYGSCPIIYNLVEELKNALSFVPKNN